MQYVVFIVVGVGLFFVTIFHLGVKERPRESSHQFATRSSRRSASNWVMWFKVPLFYQVHDMLIGVKDCIIRLLTDYKGVFLQVLFDYVYGVITRSPEPEVHENAFDCGSNWNLGMLVFT
jgi:hypothetical protein